MTTKTPLHPGKKDWKTLAELRERFAQELPTWFHRKEKVNTWNAQLNSDNQYCEVYRITKDGVVIATFLEGQPDRHGKPMHYAEFIREFTSFVLAWHGRVDASRFGYRVTAGK